MHSLVSFSCPRSVIFSHIGKLFTGNVQLSEKSLCVLQASSKMQVSGLKMIHIVVEWAAFASVVIIIGPSFTQRKSMTHGECFLSFVSARCLIRGKRASVPIVLLVLCYIWRVEPWQRVFQAAAMMNKPASDEFDKLHCFCRDKLQHKLGWSQEAGFFDLLEEFSIPMVHVSACSVRSLSFFQFCFQVDHSNKMTCYTLIIYVVEQSCDFIKISIKQRLICIDWAIKKQ